MQEIPVAKVDLAVFHFINGFAKKSKALDFFAIFCAEYLGYLLVVFLAGAAILGNNWQIFIIPLIAGLISRFLIAEAVYFFYQRQRPVEVLPITALIKKPNHPAFPSGHASFFFALAFTLFLFNFPLAIAFVVVSFFISDARIFCGVHWPSDIIGGICSAGVAFLVVYLVTIII